MTRRRCSIERLSRRPRLLVAGALVVTTAASCPGCGGTEASDRAQVMPSMTEPLDFTECEEVSEEYVFHLLEPFLPPQVNDNPNRTLGWYVSFDESNVLRNEAGGIEEYYFSPTPVGQIIPQSDGAPSLGEDVCEESSSSMRLLSEGDPDTGEGFTDWGMNFGSNMNAENDATAWDGIAFWAKRSEDTPENRTLKVTVPDQYTATNLGTYCVDGLYDDESCDAYGRAVKLDDEWKLYLLYFDEMYQEGFGRASPLPTPELEAIGGVTFLMGKGTWEVWVDEVAYFRER